MKTKNRILIAAIIVVSLLLLTEAVVVIRAGTDIQITYFPVLVLSGPTYTPTPPPGTDPSRTPTQTITPSPSITPTVTITRTPLNGTPTPTVLTEP